uniref:Uncharacterized protein n=1 Tax=Arundo donax TaxID=35708 RepID=A0A0A8ZLW3_ARUDO
MGVATLMVNAKKWFHGCSIQRLYTGKHCSGNDRPAA